MMISRLHSLMFSSMTLATAAHREKEAEDLMSKAAWILMLLRALEMDPKNEH